MKAEALRRALAEVWKQPVVENKPGGAGIVGAEFAARAGPDGTTLLMGHVGTQSINPCLDRRLPCDPDKAFAPISPVATKMFWIGAARGRVLTCVRPLLRPSQAAGPDGSSRIRSTSMPPSVFIPSSRPRSKGRRCSRTG